MSHSKIQNLHRRLMTPGARPVSPSNFPRVMTASEIELLVFGTVRIDENSFDRVTRFWVHPRNRDMIDGKDRFIGRCVNAIEKITSTEQWNRFLAFSPEGANFNVAGELLICGDSKAASVVMSNDGLKHVVDPSTRLLNVDILLEIVATSRNDQRTRALFNTLDTHGVLRNGVNDATILHVLVHDLGRRAIKSIDTHGVDDAMTRMRDEIKLVQDTIMFLYRCFDQRFINMADADGNTALHAALACRSKTLHNFLTKLGAVVTTNVNGESSELVQPPPPSTASASTAAAASCATCEGPFGRWMVCTTHFPF